HPEKAKYLAKYYAGPTPSFSADLASVVDNPEIHMVIVATPPSVRASLIEPLAMAGKHILLEKPVARTTGEAEDVVDICERAGVRLGMLFQHRVQETSQAAQRLIASGELGRLGHVEIAAPMWRDQSYYDELDRGTYARDGGGVLMTQAIHTINLALSLTGPVACVQAMTATSPLHQMEAEDFAVAGLQFVSGAVGSLVASTASFPHGDEVINLHFERGSLHLGRATLDRVWRTGERELVVADKGDLGEAGPVVTTHGLHQGVIEDFVEAIQNNRAPLVSGRDALETHRLIEAFETSSRTGCRVDVPV
ncbi:Gfo/Idh/MocA family oxidoreductase, partial [Roseobacter sp.]|uniref:Gfo/Idh/MocA family protein n=1 Tax=Roseobacter sp. TaxID=1907202 RepID=UPI0032992C02